MTDINTLLDEFADCQFQCGAMSVDDTVKYREMVDRSIEIRKALIAFYSEQSGFISIEDRLPEDNQEVLCYRGNRDHEGLNYLTALYIYGNFYAPEGITHWQPLPPPPTAEEEPEYLDIPMFLRRQAE